MNGQDAKARAKDSSAREENEGGDEEENDDGEKNEGGDEEENDDGLLMKIVAQRAGSVPIQESTALAAVPSSEDLATQDMVLLKTSKVKGSNSFVDQSCGPNNNNVPAGEAATENARVGGEESNPHSLLGIAVGIRQELVPGAYAESGTQSIIGDIQPEHNGSIGSPGQTPPFEIELPRAWPVSPPIAVADEEPVIWGNKKCWGGQSWISTKKGILLVWVSLLLLLATVFLTPLVAQKLQAMGGNQDVIRQQHIKKTIERVFGENYFDNEQKERALHWIVYDDPLKDLAVKEDRGEDAVNSVIQRFSLVAIYYQTNARQPWNYCNPPVGKQSNWCYYTFYEKLRLIKENPSEEMSARWLSATHECQWMGIYCEEGSKHVSEFQMRSNSFHGTIPAELSKLTYIKTLDLGSNFLSGSLPSWIGHLTLLESLKLPANQLSGRIPPSYLALPALRILSLNNNLLTGAIPSQVGSFLGEIIWLKLEGNLLTGSIPEEIFSLSTLQLLTLGNNQITGLLSRRLGELVTLIFLYLDHSGGLHGPIPSQIGLLTNLAELTIGGDSISGPIPEELYGLRSLLYLHLSNSAFSGTISSRIGLLTLLKELSIANNNIGGSIPGELAKLTNLMLLDVSGNPTLTGSIPKHLCSETHHDSDIRADCTPKDSTGIPAVFCPDQCCSACCDVETMICNEK